MSVEQYNKELMKNDIIKELKESKEEIERGEGIDSDEAFNEFYLVVTVHSPVE